MAGSLTLMANRPYPLLFRPQPIFTFEAVDLGGMQGCQRKLLENVREVIVKIEKTNTWERQRQRQTKTKMSKNEE